MIQTYINHFAPEDIHNPQNFGTVLGFSHNLDQGHLSVHKFLTGKIVDFNHINELVKLFFNLFNDRRFSGGNQGDPRYQRIGCFGNAEAFNVKSPAAEQSRNSGEYTGFVVY